MGSTGNKAKFVRLLGEGERFFWLFDQINCMNFAVYAELECSLSKVDLERAFNELVSETPVLRVRVQTDDKKLFFAEKEIDDIKIEVIEGVDGWRSTVSNEIGKPFLPFSWPAVRCFLFADQKNLSVVVLIFQHTIADGRSGARFLQKLIRRALGEKCDKQGQTIISMPPAAEKVFPEKYSHFIGKLKGSLLRISEGVEWRRNGFPEQIPGYDSSIRRQRVPRAYPLIIEEEVVKALRRRTRSERTTLYGALAAAQLQALRDEFGDQASHPMTLTSLADLRHMLTVPLTDDELGMYITFLVTAHRVECGEGIWALAREIRGELKKKMSRGYGHLFWQSLPPPSIVPPDQKGAARLLKITRLLSPASTLISHGGNLLDKKLNKMVKVRALSGLICPSSITPINNTQNFWNGSLYMNLNYDALKMDDARVERIAKKMEKLLVQAIE